MTTTKATLPHVKNDMFGWQNQLLRIDLSERRIWVQETRPYMPAFLGGRGLAAKIVWDEFPEPVDAFDPRNPFMVMPGALTGARSPYSGRTCICAFSPQSHPYTWLTRANIGAYFGDALKKAGYDGLVVTGASESPVRILITDEQVSIIPCDELWGLDTLETQEAIADEMGSRGRSVRTLTMGPAGERLSRIATVQTDSTSVAGQGGFGAVLGSKKLKAISILGTGKVKVADPERLGHLFRGVRNEVAGLRAFRDVGAMNAMLAEEGGGKVRIEPCTAYCPTPCRMAAEGVQGKHFDRTWSGAMACVSGIFGGFRGGLYNWNFGFRGGFELNMYANRLGLNHWELIIGMIPWLKAAHERGMFNTINGRPVDWQSLDFHVEFLHDVAYREGMGNALAEGSVRAAEQLDLGQELMRRYYSGWGFAGHWDGHACLVNRIVYPFWIPSAIHWAMDTRDPASSTHGYIQNSMYWSPFGGPYKREETPITWEHMMGVADRVYGRADLLDPESGYEGKEIAAEHHAKRSIMKDCLPSDDQVFPLFYSHKHDDRFSRIGEPGGPIGVIEGPDVDVHLLNAGTGTDWDTSEFLRAAERVLNLERAISVRHWGRDRQMDARVLPNFEYEENWLNPKIGERQALDRAQFMPVWDAYLDRLGWDRDAGWPTQEALASLDLQDVHGPMVQGAAQAKQRLTPLETVPPVSDIHASDPDRSDQI